MALLLASQRVQQQRPLAAALPATHSSSSSSGMKGFSQRLPSHAVPALGWTDERLLILTRGAELVLADEVRDRYVTCYLFV